MPKIAYSEEEREQIRKALIDTGLELFSEQGIQHTTVEQIYARVGISRTFFYTFFPAKEDLVVQAFYQQQPQMLAYAQKLMDNPTLSWREGVGQFLHNSCYGGQRRFAIMSVEEQQELSKCLSGENRREFQERRLTFFTQLLHIFSIRAEAQEIKLIANLTFSAAAADEMTSFQIKAVLDYMETLRRQ